ncbi:DNA-directed RNA polymerase III complex subunit Rpc25 [Exophiala dermatitidis]|nr:DNA-directed RNA polymerase III complex subunit Rpc25 [Exophiala dermatitidis]KAJ4532906.1 DNA-directed RNA polymerase III complex subunit Rpc25 [Exophiala dermatitidis]KAJ4574051.1 DNA-directed RNA polymerase III complex subunit Rpc25 [Exophiala dermatitidis]KAJ4577296.1 DNA-directed RNA polymerase III complex subunit Rpc25 [Exophiala dermatitidis]KAJ4624000.1 DNA-directed RNA polymerase III complex subunit Rpc25 [Exophiala dermatitidis]
MLFEDCYFDEDEQTWIWKTGDASLYFDPATVVNLRVESEKWHDQAPKGPQAEGEAEKQTERKVPYAIEASMAESGLGGVDWW